MKKKTIVIMAILLLCGAAVFAAWRCFGDSSKEQGFGLFSWSAGAMAEEEAENFLACAGRAGVSEVYQHFPKESLLPEGEGQAFVARMRKKQIDVYALMGEAEWAYDAQGESLIERIGRVVDYNERQPRESRIMGVMVDVEPYLLEEWKEKETQRPGLMQSYLACIQQGYRYAAQRDLEFWVCIPIFYDTSCPDILEALVRDGCDGIAVMNYNRTDEYAQMAQEVELARAYGKGVICIYELQQPGKHDLEEINTYANQGLEALWQSAEGLEKQFQYDGLRFAYHYYQPLRQMLAETGGQGKYDGGNG